ncbi:uncharacterized protein DFL_006518 [Arthrobotrys flagrans]|uniref:Fatty acid hydroxylase domain-containing protein n=1 Tax=Arthrobotrys flagrans TaxID=97331 RepID=A0A437A175_ARTFL|nr:hypothetical protein DFL_006518 [Arthrobotrys flagrans]
MHKKHHKYVVPTPFGAYTFHPIEGWIMSLPVYAYSFILPMSDYVQLAVLVYSNLWTFILHDSREQAHTVHHKNMNFNFGQFCSLWDRLGGTYVDPGIFLKAENARNPLIGSKDLL